MTLDLNKEYIFDSDPEPGPTEPESEELKNLDFYYPPTIDSTFLSTFRSCQRKAYLQYLQHWKPKHESVHLVAGGAFAAGVETARKAFFVEKLPREDCKLAGLQALIRSYGTFEAPEGAAKSLERMCGALEFYFDRYPMREDGMEPLYFNEDQSGIELSFAVPLEFRHPVSREPLLYTGRSDMVARFAGGIYVVDEKTTSQLGASWSRAWEMRSQFTGYCFGCQSYGIQASGIVVRGVSILKTKYDTLQVLTYRSPWEIDRWEQQLYKDLETLQRCWEDNYWSWNLDHACTEYGGCPFVQVCKSPDPETWLGMYFEKKVWDPLARGEVSLGEYKRKWEHCLEPSRE